MYLTGVILALLAGAASASSRLDAIELPLGFQPEGITLTDGWTAYVASYATGTIWSGDMRTGEGEVVVPATGSMALGMDYDERTQYLYVAGGISGTVRVYDGDYNLVLDTVMDTGAALSFVNSVVVAEDYVYLTDSFRSQFYAIPLGDDAKPEDGASTVAEIVRIHGDGFPGDVDVFVDPAEDIKSNGIVLSDDGKMVIISVMSESDIYLVDTETGAARRIDLHGDRISADGLLRRGNTLWLVDNGLVTGVQAIHEVLLSEDWTCGRATRFFSSELLDFPTNAALESTDMYVINSRQVPPEEAATATYEILRMDRDGAATSCGATSGPNAWKGPIGSS